MIIIPFRELAPETLDALLQEIVTRDGTDYGDIEVAVAQKVGQVKQLLQSGVACLCYDEASESCNVLAATEVKRLMAESDGGNLFS